MSIWRVAVAVGAAASALIGGVSVVDAAGKPEPSVQVTDVYPVGCSVQFRVHVDGVKGPSQVLFDYESTNGVTVTKSSLTADVDRKTGNAGFGTGSGDDGFWTVTLKKVTVQKGKNRVTDVLVFVPTDAKGSYTRPDCEN